MGDIWNRECRGCRKIAGYPTGIPITVCMECLVENYPPIMEGSCRFCGKPERAYRSHNGYCWDCYGDYETGSMPLADLVPISYDNGDLGLLIRRFKGSFGNGKREMECAVPLRSTLYGFLHNNYQKIEGQHGHIDLFTFMPSFQNRRQHIRELFFGLKDLSRYPTQEVLAQVKDLPKSENHGLEKRPFDPSAFGVLQETMVQGKTVLLLDDVYVTGRKINSAAQALRMAGARKVIGLVFARTVKRHLESVRDYHKSHPFSFERCKYDLQ